ncbi:hypothetical protein NESM_000780900 [Novymonas esmeraldas]|uniref:Uncharacterized protein n=1 Tax=Novymonas esmeraldas TaxID=1808958 RepID=A0AAW0EZC9_9TRYP
MSTSTRRISITSEQLQNDTLRAQLFSACCAYGVVEWVRFEEDPNYNSTTVHVQFQKLSSADRLRSDVQRRGHYWQIESEPAAPCVGADVLLSSADLVRRDRLATALPGFECAATPSTSPSSTGTASAATSLPTFEEKSAVLHGRSTATRTSAASSTVTAEQEAALWFGFEQESSAVRHSCLGAYCAVLHFDSPHSANGFLLQHQLALAEQHGVYAVHAGTAPGCALAVALPKMLTRQALADCAVEGRVVRGYVVAMPSNTYCVVDAGLYPAAEQANATALVHTHTNFLSVSAGDEVQVQLSVRGGLTLAEEGMVGGKLLRVTNAAAFAARRYASKAVPAGGATRAARIAHGPGGGGGGSGTSTPTSTPPLLPRQRPGTAGPAAEAGRRGALGETPMTAAVGAAAHRPVAAGAAAKALASKLFRSIQQGKGGGAGGDGDGNSAERLCAYPLGLGVYARLLVRVERIAGDGLHARCVEDAENCGYTGPVFIPAALVPSGTSATGQGWRAFAVVGERMHVALLYMVAVGGSAATMRGVASKKDADLRRTAATAAVAPAGEHGASHDTAIAVGTTVTAVAMLKLVAGDIGVPAADQASRCFPAFLVRPGQHASASLRQTPLLLPVADLGSLDPVTLATSPAPLTICEVVKDVTRGQYAVVVPYAVFAARQTQRAAAQERRKTAEADEVKRRLAAVMGQDILTVLNGDAAPATKRPRPED